jgi:hypothetical protein
VNVQQSFLLAQEVLQEKEELRRRVGELDRSLAETRNTSKAEIRNLADEKADLRRKVDRLESRVSILRYGILNFVTLFTYMVI